MDDWFDREKLHFAVQDGDLDKVRDLVKGGCDVNAFDSDLHRTPIHYAAIDGHLHIVRYLISAGANVNARDEEKIGETPLGEVASNCSYEQAEVLVNAGANPLIPGWMQITAMDSAKKRKKPEGRRVYELLLRASVGKPPDQD